MDHIHGSGESIFHLEDTILFATDFRKALISKGFIGELTQVTNLRAMELLVESGMNSYACFVLDGYNPIHDHTTSLTYNVNIATQMIRDAGYKSPIYVLSNGICSENSQVTEFFDKMVDFDRCIQRILSHGFGSNS